MTDGERVVSFSLQYSIDDPNGQGWPQVPLSVGQDVVLDMLPNVLARRSSINQRA